MKRTSKSSSSDKDGSDKDGSDKSSGPVLLQAHINNISFHPPNGFNPKIQTVQVKLRNSITKPVAYKTLTNRGHIYSVHPNRGILDVGKIVLLDIAMNDKYDRKQYDNDNKGHQIHILGILWPRPVAEYQPDEWKRLEKEYKEGRQRLLVHINHKGLVNAPAEGPHKTSAELTTGPKLITINPSTLTLRPPLDQTQKITLTNTLPGAAVAYKLMTNKPNFYVVCPNRGVLRGGDMKACKIEINDKLAVSDFEDAEGHQFLLVAVQWPHDNTFDPAKFLTQQKLKKKEVQRLCFDVELEVDKGRQAMYLSAFPPKLSYRPPSGNCGQVACTTLVNNSTDAVAFKVEQGHPLVNRFFSVNPSTGVVQPSGSAELLFTLFDRTREEDVINAIGLSFKVTAVPWVLPAFNDVLWKEFESIKNYKFQTMKIKIDFDAIELDSQTNQSVSGLSMSGASMGGQPANSDPMMMAMMLMQMQQAMQKPNMQKRR